MDLKNYPRILCLCATELPQWLILNHFQKWTILNQMWHFYPGTTVFTDELFTDCCSGKAILE